MAAAWRVELLGRFRVLGHGVAVTRFSTRKEAMLFARLCLTMERPQTRDELVELLWPDTEPELGRRSLRVALTHLRRALELAGVHSRGDVLTADRFEVAILPGSVTTDVAAFDEAVRAAGRAADPSARAAALDAAVSLYGGEFMPGFYEDWVLQERDRLQASFTRTARRAAAVLREANALDEAIRVARRAVGCEPAEQANHALLIELLLEAGQTAAAALQYREAERVACADLGEPPCEALLRLAPRVAVHAGAPAPNTALRSGQAASVPARTAASVRSDRAAAGDAAVHAGLPVPVSRSFGREDELVRLVRMMTPGDAANASRVPQAGRLVTLTGMAGVGKTRLAVDAAWLLVGPYAGRVHFVALADLADPNLVAHQIARGLGATGATQGEALQAAIERIGPEPCLLVLDNAEHVSASVSTVVASLLRTALGMRIVVTSRRRLAIPGETVLAVRPLVSPPRELPTEAAREYPVVRLFVDRASTACPGFLATPDSVQQIAALCEHLDGLPLAIELAAARVAVLPPGAMLERIADRFDWLAASGLPVAAHQRSLWAAIEWSYRLLPPDVQRFVACLSVFRGGWTIASAERVCAEPNALDFTARLCECSLAQPVGDLNLARFAFTESIREFAATKLERDEATCVRRRHAAYYLGLVRRTADKVHHTPAAARVLDSDTQNVRAALQWLLSGGHPVAGARMAAALVEYWDLRGMSLEGLHWARMAADMVDRFEPALGYRAIRAAGRLATLQCDFATAEGYCQQALVLARDPRAHVCLARPLNALAHLQHMQGRHEESIASAEEARKHAIAAGSRAQEAAALNQLVQALAAFGDFRRSAERGREALALQRRIGGRRDVVDAALLLAETHINVGELARARTLLDEVEGICRAFDDRPGLATVLRDMGAIALDSADYAEAARLFGESEALWASSSAPEPLADLLLRRCELARRLGDVAQADTLGVAALEAWRVRGHRRWHAAALCQLSAVRLCAEKCEEALGLAMEALVLLRPDPAPWVLHLPEYHVGRALFRLRDADGAATYLTSSLRTRATVGLRLRMIDACEGLALVEEARGNPNAAARFLSCARAGRLACGAPAPPCLAAELDHLASRLGPILNATRAVPLDRVRELL